MPLLYFEYVDIGVVVVVVGVGVVVVVVVGVVVVNILIDLPKSLRHKEIQSGPLRWLEGSLLFYWQLAGAGSSQEFSDENE